MQQRFLLQILLLAEHVSGTTMPSSGTQSIIQWLLSVVFRAVVFKLLVRCGAEGYVSGLQDAAASCKPDT